MTATEAASFNQALSGGLRAEMVSLTNQQLPLSMFLEHADLGYPAFHGNRTGRQSDDMIISQLGLGIVKFKDEPGNSETDDTEYRCNTDVITSVTLSTEKELNPTNAASVTFHILGGNFTVSNIVMPAGENQLVWVKWHTPDTPQTVDISITASKGSLSADEITAKVSDLTEKTPPNPTATDRNDNFQAVAAPNKSAVSSSSWSVWSAYWVPNWIWISDWVWVSNPSWASGGKWVDEGTWEDEGKYAFRNDSFHASLSAILEDAWTLAGMLSANLTDYVTIKGNVYDDWHIGPKMVE